jgi:tetratricopeptide (TPR) repeat protein
MRSAITILAVAAVIAFALPAQAQPVVGGGVKGEFKKHQEFAKTPEEAFQEAKERQCPVILCVCEQGPGGIWAEPGEFCKTKVKDVAQYYVIIVSHPAHPGTFAWGRQWARRAGEGDLNNNIYEFFESDGTHMPRYSIRSGASEIGLIGVMTQVLKDRGKGMSFVEYRDLKPEFELAGKLLEAGWYDEAYDTYEKLAKKKFTPEPPMITGSKEKLTEIEAAVTAKLDELRQEANNGHRAEALVGLHILRARARTMKVAGQITKEIVALEKDEAITSADAKKAQLEGKACEIFLRGEGYAAEGNTKSAKSYFERVVNIYKESSFAEAAKQRLGELD